MFLQIAKTSGKNRFLNFLETLGLIVFLYIITSIPLILFSDNQHLFNSPLGLALMFLCFLGPLLGIIIGTRWFHYRSILTIFTAARQFRWKRLLFGIGLWFGVILILDLIAYGTNPSHFQFNMPDAEFWALLIVCIFLLPIQTSAEELIFRGYLLQQISLIARYRWISILITSLLFGFVHISNPEVLEYGFIKSMLLYISLGLFLCLITVLDNGLELALGVHFINNFYSISLVGYENSIFEGVPSLFMKTENELTFMAIGSNIIIMIIILYILQKVLRWPSFATLLQKI